jgi:hypothetical protein
MAGSVAGFSAGSRLAHGWLRLAMAGYGWLWLALAAEVGSLTSTTAEKPK